MCKTIMQTSNCKTNNPQNHNITCATAALQPTVSIDKKKVDHRRKKKTVTPCGIKPCANVPCRYITTACATAVPATIAKYQ